MHLKNLYTIQTLLFTLPTLIYLKSVF